MSDSIHLGLPFLQAAQAQKHVTVNDALLRLDALVHLAVESDSETVPPVSPAEGARWIVGPGATGDWTGRDGEVAAWLDGAWMFFTPRAGWRALVTALGEERLHDGTAWRAGSDATTVALSPNGASARFSILEVDHGVSAGAANDTALVIPDRAIVFGVTGRVLAEVTGPSSWTLGVAADPARYGNTIGTPAGSTVIGVSGTPTAYYADTPIRVTATGADFTGGTLRLALHFLELGLPAA
ncbi:MAG: DUF2793 domain-containing protein [Parvibaculaceae bacterium]